MILSEKTLDEIFEMLGPECPNMEERTEDEER